MWVLCNYNPTGLWKICRLWAHCNSVSYNNRFVSCDFQMQKLFEELESHFREEQEKTKLEVCM